jgi:signal transduction histidine kinase/DNA-binding response OmpR family regulator
MEPNFKTNMLICLFLWAILPFAYTQELPDTYRMQQDLAKANAFIAAYRNDTARIIVAQLMAELKKQNQLDAPFGLKVQLAQGTALEQDEQNSLAIPIVLHVKEQCLEAKLWDIFTQSTIELALLYEKTVLAKPALENLREAQNTISRYGLDSLYPPFAIRLSSYHRILGDKDSSLFYAHEALRTALQFKLDVEEATAHMLIHFLFRDRQPPSYEQSLEHAFAALRIYQKLEDNLSTCYMYNSISIVYYKLNKTQLALTFTDSTIVAAHKAIASGDDRIHALSLAYTLRGTILKDMGQTDSAWYYMNKGHKMELDWVTNNENYKIIEVEARYNDEKRITQITKQTQQRNGLLAIGLLILLFAAALSYYYLKLRKANDITQKQEAQLRMLDAAKSRFFANVSHELRTPLTLILGPLSTLLKNESLNNMGLRQAQLAQSNAQNLLKLVNEILDLSKLESGKMQLQETTVRFQPFISRLVSAFESHAEYLGIHFRMEYKAAERLRLDLDAEKMTQIVNNLLSNALKFTPRNGSVSVKIEDLSNVIRLTVSDTGRGIHPNDLPKVFERFYQTNQVDAAVEGGTGIGLALCRELAAVMEGRIWVKSVLGKGSQFYVEFPKKEVLGIGNDELGRMNDEYTEGGVLAAATDATGLVLNTRDESSPNLITQSQNHKITQPLNHSTILIVEDNLDLRAYIADILRGSNYAVLETENGLQALDLLQELQTKNQLPQLILSDIMMPVMDGFQLLKVLKDRPYFQQIPVVMLTARADIRDKLTALRIGVDDYLLKPFDEEELLTRIHNLLKNSQLRQQFQLELANEVVSNSASGSGNFESSPNLNAALSPKVATQNGQNTEGVLDTTQNPILDTENAEWLEGLEKKVLALIGDSNLNVDRLADDLFTSRNSFYKKVKALTGMTPNEYVQAIRYNQARQLLEMRRSASVKETAFAVGVRDVKYFSEQFRKRFGKLPSDYLG